MVNVKIPTPLLKLTGNESIVEVEGKTVFEVTTNLEKNYPGIGKRLFNGAEVNRFINIYVDGEDIRFSKGLDTEVKGDSEVSIVPAISGG